MERLGTSSPAKGILVFLSPKSQDDVKKDREDERRRHAEATAKQHKDLIYDAEEELQKKTLSKTGRDKIEKALEEARALLKQMGKTAASSGRAMKKPRAASKAKSK